MLDKLLREWGYEVILVPDGQQAWDLLRQEDGPRLALLDWMMPGMEGAEVCRRVRSSIRERYVYMMLLSVRADLQDVVTGMESGADDYIVKPFQVEELRARLRACACWLYRKSWWRRARRCANKLRATASPDYGTVGPFSTFCKMS